jgi:hypothetical protein
MFDNDGDGLSFFQGFPTLAPFPWVHIVCLSLFVDSCLSRRRVVRSGRYELCVQRVQDELSTESHFLVLPQGDGKLPIWQLAIAVTALFNTVQNFVTLKFTTRIYNNVPATHPGILSSHTSSPFG